MIVAFSIKRLKNIATLVALKNDLESERKKQLYNFRPLTISLSILCRKTGNENYLPIIRSKIAEVFAAEDFGAGASLIYLSAEEPMDICLSDMGFKHFSTILEQFFDPGLLSGLEEYLRKYNLNERKTYDAIRGSSTLALQEWHEDFNHPKPEYDLGRCRHVAGMIELELQRRKEESSHA